MKRHAEWHEKMENFLWDCVAKALNMHFSVYALFLHPFIFILHNTQDTERASSSHIL